MMWFKRKPKTGVMVFGHGGTLRIGYGTIPPDYPTDEIAKATIREVEQYLKGVMR